MNQDVRKMLEGMYDLLTQKFHDPVKAWDSLIEFLAVDNCGSLIHQLDHKFEWLFDDMDFAKRLTKAYDFELLKSDYYDYLGEMYLERIVGKKEAGKGGLYLTPMNVADSMAAMTIKETDKSLNILDPAVGTGRLLMGAHKRAPNALLFGVDIDLFSAIDNFGATPEQLSGMQFTFRFSNGFVSTVSLDNFVAISRPTDFSLSEVLPMAATVPTPSAIISGLFGMLALASYNRRRNPIRRS